jgi:hypothetical protein
MGKDGSSNDWVLKMWDAADLIWSPSCPTTAGDADHEGSDNRRQPSS